MNGDDIRGSDPIEAALRRQPADERTYDAPLGALADSAPVRGDVRVAGAGRPHRRRVRSSVPVLAALCLVVAIGAGGLTVALMRGAPKGGGQTGSGGAAPTPTTAATPRPSGLIGCMGQEPGFPPDRLAGTGADTGPTATDEAGASPAAAALRKLLSEGAAGDLPASGWTLVSMSDDEALFVAQDAVRSGDYFDVDLRRESGPFLVGGWSAYTWGECGLMAVPPAGYGPATWTMDPTFSLAGGQGSELPILVTEMACHGSDPTALDRIKVDVAYTADKIVVTASARTLPGAQTCPGTLATSVVVRLDQPLGGRGVFDGGPWPVQQRVVGGATTPAPTPTPPAGSPTITSKTIIDAAPDGAWTRSQKVPVLSGVPSAAAMNRAIEAKVAAIKAQFLETVKQLSGAYKAKMVGDYSVAFVSPAVVSLRFSFSVDTGQIAYFTETLNLRVSDGKVIALQDLFVSEPLALTILSHESRDLLLAQFPDLDKTNPLLFTPGTSEDLANFSAWTFTTKGLEITFQEAQVGPRAIGLPLVVIPWDQLGGVIAPKGPAGQFAPPDAGPS